MAAVFKGLMDGFQGLFKKMFDKMFGNKEMRARLALVGQANPSRALAAPELPVERRLLCSG